MTTILQKKEMILNFCRFIGIISPSTADRWALESKGWIQIVTQPEINHTMSHLCHIFKARISCRYNYIWVFRSHLNSFNRYSMQGVDNFTRSILFLRIWCSPLLFRVLIEPDDILQTKDSVMLYLKAKQVTCELWVTPLPITKFRM